MGKFDIIDRNVELDNGSTYKIVYSISSSNGDVYYLINVNDFSDLKFCYWTGDNEFEEIRDIDKLKDIVGELNESVNIFIR